MSQFRNREPLRHPTPDAPRLSPVRTEEAEVKADCRVDACYDEDAICGMLITGRMIDFGGFYC